MTTPVNEDTMKYLYMILPGVVGALASTHFVDNDTWTSRAIGFAVAEVAALTYLNMTSGQSTEGVRDPSPVIALFGL